MDCVHFGPSGVALLRVGPKVPRSHGSLAAGPRSPHMLQTWALIHASFHVFMQTSLSAGSGVPIVSAMFADAPEPQRWGFPGGMTPGPQGPSSALWPCFLCIHIRYVEDASKIALLEIEAAAWTLVCGDGADVTVPGGAWPFGGVAGPVRPTDIRYWSRFLLVFVFWSIRGISYSIFQSRPGHTKASFTCGLSSRPRPCVIVQSQRLSRSWAGAVWVWKVSPRGLFLIPGARCWWEGQAGSSVWGQRPHVRAWGEGAEPRCGTRSSIRFPQNSSGLSYNPLPILGNWSGPR